MTIWSPPGDFLYWQDHIFILKQCPALSYYGSNALDTQRPNIYFLERNQGYKGIWIKLLKRMCSVWGVHCLQFMPYKESNLWSLSGHSTQNIDRERAPAKQVKWSTWVSFRHIPNGVCIKIVLCSEQAGSASKLYFDLNISTSQRFKYNNHFQSLYLSFKSD